MALIMFENAMMTLFCANLANQELPPGYYPNMQAYLDTMKKEKTKARGDGKTEETEADPIPFALYQDICTWSVESKNVMVWAFTCLQWNCMGRSVNIAPLGFRNVSQKEANDYYANILTGDTTVFALAEEE